MLPASIIFGCWYQTYWIVLIFVLSIFFLSLITRCLIIIYKGCGAWFLLITYIHGNFRTNITYDSYYVCVCYMCTLYSWERYVMSFVTLATYLTYIYYLGKLQAWGCSVFYTVACPCDCNIDITLSWIISGNYYNKSFFLATKHFLTC